MKYEPGTNRTLLVTADDFGIGPRTSRGILDLAQRGVVTSSVLLANSPYAGDAVREWRKRGCPLELGWHPCLTLDAPISDPERVPSLVGGDGRFLPLGQFLKRLIRGRIRSDEIEIEFRAQLRKYSDLVGESPANVNAHHHVHIFGPVGRALRTVLGELDAKPFLRRVVEPMRTLTGIRGARVKRFALTRFGRLAAKWQAAEGFPGAEWLLGITDPPFVHRDDFFAEWLAVAPGQRVELTCHPGLLDATIEGRDGSLTDGQLHRRQREYDLLSRPEFAEAVRTAGFQLVNASAFLDATRSSRASARPSPTSANTPRGESPRPRTARCDH